MVNKKLAALIVVFVGVLIADYAKVYVPETFEDASKYKLKVMGMKFLSFIGRTGAKLNLGHEATLFRKGIDIAASLVRLMNYKDETVVTEDTQIDSINVRIYRKANIKRDERLPLMIYIHGGAYVVGNLDSYDQYLYGMVQKIPDLVIISIDYHLAPEYPWPRPIEDCYRVTQYIIKHAAQFNIDVNRIVMAGDSAGGNAVALLTQRLAKEKQKVPKLQVLIYPWTQMYNSLLPSEIHYGEIKGFFSHSGFSLARYQLWLVGLMHPTTEMENAILSNNHTLLIEENLRKKYQKYLDVSLISEEYKTNKLYYQGYENKKMQDYVYPSKLDEDNILRRDKNLAKLLVNLITTASPGLADDEILKQLPKAYFITVEWDSLKDQGLIYAERLRRNGVETTVKFLENAYHGSISIIDEAVGYQLSRSTFDELVKYIKENI